MKISSPLKASSAVAFCLDTRDSVERTVYPKSIANTIP